MLAKFVIKIKDNVCFSKNINNNRVKRVETGNNGQELVVLLPGLNHILAIIHVNGAGRCS